MVAGKAWGCTETIYEDGHVCVNKIWAAKGGFCSVHKHIKKQNLFHIISGKLRIDVEKNGYDLVDSTVIETGQSTIVPAGEYHQFVALEDSVALEIYFVDLDEDIIRKSVGGSDYKKSAIMLIDLAKEKSDKS